jgi:hypothetical protein
MYIAKKLASASAGLMFFYCVSWAATAGASLPDEAVPPLGAFDCTHECRTCTLGHDIVESVTLNAITIHLESCNAGACSLHDCEKGGMMIHSMAPGSVSPANRIAELWLAMHAGGEIPIAQVLAEYSDVAILNRERGAIQASCMSGNLVLNIPLDEAQLYALSN